jgi:hypothetical protein
VPGPLLLPPIISIMLPAGAGCSMAGLPIQQHSFLLLPLSLLLLLLLVLVLQVLLVVLLRGRLCTRGGGFW